YPALSWRDPAATHGTRAAIREVHRNGTPVYAECGGLMDLTDRMVLQKGWQGSDAEQSGEMCGVFRGETRMPARRVVTYVEGTSAPDSPVGVASFRGHAFHYSEVLLEKETRYAYTLSRGVGIHENLDGAVVAQTLGSYTHLHPVASAGMFRHFVDLCRKKA
ncbi:MAG: Ni-sirohydrochlorin a,c-diamide synthase, partial [Methanoregula sp.]